MSSSSRSSPLLSTPGTTPPVDLLEDLKPLEVRVSGSNALGKDEGDKKDLKPFHDSRGAKRSYSEALEDSLEYSDEEKIESGRSRFELKPNTKYRHQFKLIVYKRRRRRSVAPSPDVAEMEEDAEVKDEEDEEETGDEDEEEPEMRQAKKRALELESEEERRARWERLAAPYRNIAKKTNVYDFVDLLPPQLNLPDFATRMELFTRRQLGGPEQKGTTPPTAESRLPYDVGRCTYVTGKNIIEKAEPGYPFLKISHDYLESNIRVKDWPIFLSKMVRVLDNKTGKFKTVSRWVYIGNGETFAYVRPQPGEYSSASPKGKERAIDGYMGYAKNKIHDWMYSKPWLEGVGRSTKEKRDWIAERLEKNKLHNGYNIMICNGSDRDKEEFEHCLERRDNPEAAQKRKEIMAKEMKRKQKEERAKKKLEEG